jgi:hypothetical protein
MGGAGRLSQQSALFELQVSRYGTRCFGDKNQESVDRFFFDAILLYLAVAHFGRGRGEWSRSEHPEHWRAVVQRVVEGNSADFPKVAQDGAPLDCNGMQEEFGRRAGWAIERVLSNLYPDTGLPKIG